MGSRRSSWRDPTGADRALSQTRGVVGHRFMTNFPNSPDLPAIAYEAQVEIMVAETVEAAGPMPDDAAHGFETAEIGYYEAELRSLRDAATTLNDAELLG
jgi:hypothetical protein